jgi:hypothetical protein
MNAVDPEAGQNKNWAVPVGKLETRGIPSGAVNLNVDGRELTGPLQGFGQLSQKTYKVRLSGAKITPAEVVSVWKREFPSFWPEGNYFFAPLTGIQPGEVVVLNLAGPGGINAPGGAPLISTGVMVVYADEESFSFMTPAGHMFAALITFSAHDDEGTVAQVQAFIRASDPLYELTLRMGMGHRMEDAFWSQTLQNLSRRFGVTGFVQQQVVCVDPRLQWSQAKNIWQNAALRTLINTPLIILKRIFSPRQ